MLEKYVSQFSHLRTDKGRNRYPAITKHRAPHKPFLLLSVMDLIAQGQITRNLIEPSFELLETFNGYWSAVMPPGAKTSMAYPFSRLQTDGFWHRIPKPSYEARIEYHVKSMVRFREMFLGARLDDRLFAFLFQPDTREYLRMVVINTYFTPEIQPLLIRQGKVNVEAYEYSQRLLGAVNDPAGQWEGSQEPEAPLVRDQGFRKAIVVLYNHRCALCGIRILTPEGHTVVEAAHIRSWSESHDDRPTNGLALCRLCHWSFDEGLMSVGQVYEVLVSRRVRTDQNMPGHMLTLADRPIFRPSEERLWPAQDNFDWHRRLAFKG
ncbi:MAG: HNH endonuclease [Deltaproteobacteria bacterium]|nr:HNH endonuclease [Deltaproteobacteria bacterium]